MIRTSDGVERFVDAPEVERTAERAVTLTITAAQVSELGPPDDESCAGAAPSSGCSAACAAAEPTRVAGVA